MADDQQQPSNVSQPESVAVKESNPSDNEKDNKPKEEIKTDSADTDKNEDPPKSTQKDSQSNKPEKAEKEEIKLKGESKKILESVEKLTVLELSELVKAMETRFGVSAAVPVAPAGGPAPSSASAGEGEEKSSFDVELTSGGSQKIAVIKAIREITPLGLKEAKDLVDGAPKIVKESVKKEEADEIKKKLEEAGGTVTLK